MTTMTYGQLVEAYVAVREERDRLRADLQIAEDRLDWLRKRVRLAMDLLCSPTVPHEPGPDVPGAYGILSHALAATAPETGPTAPQTDEQAQVRGDSRTEASAGADGPWSDAWCRTQLQRLSIAASEQYGLRWRDYDVVGAVIAEIDRLRTEAKRLSARVREWEAVNADLAARCDSGDIPIRLGERYSQAVLREIDRVRTERDRLLEELPEDHTIAAAIRGLRAARSATPDTGSTTP